MCADRCMAWCAKPSDCSSASCRDCELCKAVGLHSQHQCEPWCNKANCRKVGIRWG